jgi:hypothetical protein
MAASARRSSSALLALAGLAGCVETLPPLTGTTSLSIELITPTAPGSFDERLPDTAREVTLSVRALDTRGEVDATFSGAVDVYSHFLGGLTPELGSTRGPLERLTLVDGVSDELALSLPPMFGPSFLWLEDADNGTFATGTSPTLWFRDPFLEDISRPIDETALGALERSPLERKQINVTGSRYGDRGRLVVTGIYAQGYTLSDVQCQDAAGTPPCTTDAYDGMFVFSFSRPEDEDGRPLVVGDSIIRLTGSIGEFNGLTEVNFPQSFRGGEPAAPARVPAPAVIDPAWLISKSEMERVESALVAVEGATVCELDQDFATYAQWKLDVGHGCPSSNDQKLGKIINVITKGQVNDFVPADHVGQVLPRVTGTLRPVNTAGGGFNVWILYPRSLADLELP